MLVLVGRFLCLCALTSREKPPTMFVLETLFLSRLPKSPALDFAEWVLLFPNLAVDSACTSKTRNANHVKNPTDWSLSCISFWKYSYKYIDWSSYSINRESEVQQISLSLFLEWTQRTYHERVLIHGVDGWIGEWDWDCPGIMLLIPCQMIVDDHRWWRHMPIFPIDKISSTNWQNPLALIQHTRQIVLMKNSFQSFFYHSWNSPAPP